MTVVAIRSVERTREPTREPTREAARESAPRAVRSRLSGWGRFPVAEMDVLRPERMDALAAAVAAGGSVLPRGLGRSYGDAALNRAGSVILSTRLNRFLDFDPATGVLACEAGVTFEDILRHFVPRGFFPPVVPGTQFVTLGGAVACDVHGKNHHVAGSIARHIVDFRLVTADGGVLRCSRAEHPEVFWATLGGMGLTGFVAEVRLRLRPITSAYVRVDQDRAPDLDVALAHFEESDDRYQHSVAWIDCLARGRSLGRSVLMRGNAAAAAELEPATAAHPFGDARRGRARVPVDLPGFLLNGPLMRAFNSAFYHGHRASVRDACTHFEPFFFPLDRIRDWNRLYGRRGFLQYQLVLPTESGREGLRRILDAVARSGIASFLAVLKRFGPSDPDAMLSFPLPGYTLALDIPFRPDVLPLLDRLDALVADGGGRVYLAKDARLGAAVFQRMYPALPRWREVRERLDPMHRFASDLSRRLGLES
jgi:FAD/FMN-containing dehydrogenase